MTPPALSSESIPKSCLPFVETFKHHAPGQLPLEKRRMEFAWRGGRLLTNFKWSRLEGETVADLRLQLLPRERWIWIGDLAVHPPFRDRGYGSILVRSIEKCALAHSIEAIRLYSRFRSLGFWHRLGYQAEHNPRYLQKSACNLRPDG